ncbi:hypothetical protein CIB48_g10455 [Xylaria polymorpha]|nr:hypothetical protein CIB48_g10455 [Xylaria polymorpha]
MSAFAVYFNSLSPEEQSIALNGSALPPPTGVLPDFANPPNSDSLTHGVLATVLIVTTAAIILALYGKAILLKKAHFEDGFALIAIISWVAYIGLLYTALVDHGFFIHQWNFRLRDIPGYLHPFYNGILVYFVTMALIKPAIVLEWKRLFVPRGTRNAFWWTCWIVAILNFIASIVMLFLNVFACNPREAFWNPLVEGTCTGALATIYIAPIINLIVDIVILVLPQRVIWGLHLSWHKKIGVSFLFGLGILAVISTSFRIASAFNFAGSADQTYNVAGNYLWALAEMSAGILVYCAPAIPGAIKSLLGRPMTTVGSQASSYKYSGSKPSSWPRTTTPASRRYEEIDEVPLTSVPRLNATVQSASRGSNRYDQKDGILRTTEVATTVSSYATKIRHVTVFHQS